MFFSPLPAVMWDRHPWHGHCRADSWLYRIAKTSVHWDDDGTPAVEYDGIPLPALWDDSRFFNHRSSALKSEALSGRLQNDAPQSTAHVWRFIIFRVGGKIYYPNIRRKEEHGKI